MKFFDKFQLITEDQFKKLDTTIVSTSDKTDKFTTSLHGRVYYVLKSNDKFYISRKPDEFSGKWMDKKEFDETINVDNEFKRVESDQKTKKGNKMFSYVNDEIQYIVVLTDDGKELISRENKIII